MLGNNLIVRSGVVELDSEVRPTATEHLNLRALRCRVHEENRFLISS